MSRRRLALLFGNNNYGDRAQLNSCVKDAEDMTIALRKLSEYMYGRFMGKSSL